MAGPVSFVHTNFTGGEISQSAQGAMDSPAYKISMNICLNWVPQETGSLQRRPGTRHVAPARGGNTGRLISFAFEDAFPYQMEFTDGFLRFTTGPALVMTNDQQQVVVINTANPAQVQTAYPHGWSTGNSVAFNSLGVNDPLLQNRQFKITIINNVLFSIADATTGAAIDGSTLGAFVSGNVTRILEIATTYSGGTWSALRSVQAETRTVLLSGAHPQVLQVATPPTLTQFATFTFTAADFLDGPYLDPVAGSIANPGGLNGLIGITLSFSAYDSTVAYTVGAFVTLGGQGYKSLISPNQGNNPATSPADWAQVNGGAAINNGQGFLTSDIGRLIRLFSEPALWIATSTYATGNIVAYPDGVGGFSYWTATDAIAAGIQPGTSTSWALNATGAQWTWGQITSVSGIGLINPVSAIGTLGGGGGLASAFDGNTTKAFASAANFSVPITTYPSWAAARWTSGAICQYNGVAYQANLLIVPSDGNPTWSSITVYAASAGVDYGGFVYQAISGNINKPPNANPAYWTLIAAISTAPPAGGLWTSLGPLPGLTADLYIGQNYTVAQAILSATVYPTTDQGFANNVTAGSIQFNLRAKATAPASPGDGTLLASLATANTLAPITLTSNNTTSTWKYIWIEVIAAFPQALPVQGPNSFTAIVGISQVQFYSPNINNGSVATVQIRGPALLYNQPVRTWQIGVYSDTTGWPTCGAYHESRIWLGGVVSNRFDAAVSNGLIGAQLNFAPTSPDGTVSDNNSISYICDGEDSNQFLWMKSDQQGVIAGTQAGEWLISAPAAGAMSPTNIKAVRVTRIGCANAEPRRTEHTLIVIQKFARKLVEFFADVFSGKYTAPNLSERAKHLTVNGIAEIAYQQELAPTLWSRLNLGGLIGAIYKRDTLMTSQGPTMIGWFRAQLGSGRLVESISVGPSAGGNLENLSMITNDPSTGVRHVELMTDLLDEGFALPNAWYLDDAIIPSSTSAAAVVTHNPPQAGDTPYGGLVLNGLWDHNGKTVTAFIAGLDCGDYTVASGSITVPYGDGISGGTGSGLFTQALVQSFPVLPAIVGFTYNSDGQLVRPIAPAEVGTQAGPGFAKLGREHYAAALLYGCVNGSISFGTDFVTLDPAKLTDAADNPYPVNQLWNGIWRDQVESIIDFDNMIAFRVSRPFPAFIMAVGGFDAKADA